MSPTRPPGVVRLADDTDTPVAHGPISHGEMARAIRALADSIPQQVWTAGRNGVIDHVNVVVAEYFGLPAQEIIDTGWLGMLHPDDVERASARWQLSLDTGIAYEIEFRLRRHDGVHRWHLGRATPERDARDQIVRWYGTNTDIDDRKRMESELRESQVAAREAGRRFQVLAEAMPLIAWSMAPDAVDVYINPQWSEYTGQPPESSFADQWRAALHPDEYDAVFATWAAAGEAKKAWQLEYRLRRHDGAYRWHLGRSVPDLDGDGNVARWYGTATDIHEQRMAILGRDELLATVSHDLRDPLATIALASASMREIGGDPAIPAVADAIDRAVERMGHLIGDLLDIASIDNGRLSIERAPCGVNSLLEEAAGAAAARVTAAGLILEIGPTQPDLRVDCDRRRVLQVFANLVGNAVKFTPRGGTIRLDVSDVAREITFCVRDSGRGIDPAQLGHVFERFWKSRDRNRSGTGLGLAICRGIVEQHGGRIWVTSTLGAGATFCFTLLRA